MQTDSSKLFSRIDNQFLEPLRTSACHLSTIQLCYQSKQPQPGINVVFENKHSISGTIATIQLRHLSTIQLGHHSNSGRRFLHSNESLKGSYSYILIFCCLHFKIQNIHEPYTNFENTVSSERFSRKQGLLYKIKPQQSLLKDFQASISSGARSYAEKRTEGRD